MNTTNDIRTETIATLDLARYMGKWYEIARFDHFFEKNMVGVSADYLLLPDGKIQVTNSGFLHELSGEYKTIIGKAKMPNPQEPGKLKVSFFLWFYSDYFIFELDPNYQYALVGSSSDKYLWILSRTPTLPSPVTNQLLQKAQARGYNTNALIWVKQPEFV